MNSEQSNFLMRLVAALIVLVVSFGIAGLLAKLLYDSNPTDYGQALPIGVFVVVALLLFFIGFKFSQRLMK